MLHLSLTDAMGHGVEAALTASTCLGGLRGARRRGMSLLEQARRSNDAVAEHAVNRAGDDFVTGLIGRVELRTGAFEVVNAGHVAPYLFRDSSLVSLDLRVDLPFGMFADSSYGSTVLALEPGDRVVLVTDGMLEDGNASIDVPGAILKTRRISTREKWSGLWRTAHSPPPAMPCATTPPCCAWTGTGCMTSPEVPYRGQTSHARVTLSSSNAPCLISPLDLGFEGK